MDIPELRFTRDLELLGDDARRLRRDVMRGGAVRPHRGAFVDAGEWAALSDQGRFLTRIAAAAAATRESPIVSHLSAAAVWGAPIIGQLPAAIDVLATVAAGTRTEHGFRKHASAFHDGIEVVDRIPVTSLIRTLADVAVTSPFVTAVGVLDWAFARHGVAAADVLADLDRRRVVRGRVRAERAATFADGRSGSPGETLSRVRIHELGFPSPELQCRFSDRLGLVGIVDFWWPDYRLIGEFDGLEKYVREAYTGGRTTAEVVIDEKRREDRLRALDPGLGITRWEWADAWRGAPLAAKLRAAGLSSTRRR
jgi:hypothetical protein